MEVVEVWLIKCPLLGTLGGAVPRHVGVLLKSTAREVEVHRGGLDGRTAEVKGRGEHSAAAEYERIGEVRGIDMDVLVNEMRDWCHARTRYVVGEDDCYSMVQAFCERHGLRVPAYFAEMATMRRMAGAAARDLHNVHNVAVDVVRLAESSEITRPVVDAVRAVASSEVVSKAVSQAADQLGFGVLRKLFK